MNEELKCLRDELDRVESKAGVHPHGHDAGRAPSDDNLLEFYVADRDEWERAVRRMDAHGYNPVEPLHPFWAY